ncbi:Transposase [Theobroma cacao]|nr:Transposase [Theobroma cacao]
MRGVRSDLSFVGLMKLVEDIVRVNAKIDEIELHALISTPRKLSRPIIKDDEDVALILLEQRNVLAVYVSIKGRQTNVMSHGEVGQHGNQLNQNEIYNASHIPQHSVRNPQQWQLRYAREFVQPECVMPLSNENTTIEDNNVRLEGDTTTLEYNTAFDEGNEDLFATGEDRFDHTSDDGLEQSQDDSSDDDCLYDSDIPICNNVEGKTEFVRGVDVGDVQCDDSIYNNPIAGVERFSFQTITTEELTCAEDCLYKGRMFSSKAELKRGLNMLVIKEKFAIRVKRSCKGRYEVGCKDKACKFSVRATKSPDRGEYWKVQTFHKVHTCTVDGLQGRFPTTSAKIIGELMSHKIRANGVALRPKDIICEMRVQWGLECLYGKAWQAKEYAERLVFYPLEESFQLLPSYFYMLEQENPGTVIAVATDEEERFKYCF